MRSPIPVIMKINFTNYLINKSTPNAHEPGKARDLKSVNCNVLSPLKLVFTLFVGFGAGGFGYQRYRYYKGPDRTSWK